MKLLNNIKETLFCEVFTMFIIFDFLEIINFVLLIFLAFILHDQLLIFVIFEYYKTKTKKLN